MDARVAERRVACVAERGDARDALVARVAERGDALVEQRGDGRVAERGDTLVAGPVVELVTEIVAVLVDEEERDPGFLHEAAQEGIITLAVLNAQLQAGVLPAIQPPLRLDTPLSEELLEDRWNALVLENAVIAPLGQKPQSGHDGQIVGREPRGLDPHLLHPTANSGPPALPPHARREEERGVLADEARQIEIGVLRPCSDRHGEERVQPFLDAKVPHRQRLVSTFEYQFEMGHADFQGLFRATRGGAR